MIIEVEDTLYEQKQSDDVRACSKCDLKDGCNDLAEALCTKMNGYGKYFVEMDADNEFWLRNEAELAHGKEVWK